MTNANNTVTLHDGTEYDGGDAILASDGEYYLPADVVTLECGTIVHAECAVQLTSGDWVDQDDDRICECYDGEFRWVDDCVSIDGEFYPEHMTASCSLCGDNIRRRDSYSSPGGDHLCGDCYDDHVSCCEDCGTEHWNDDICDGQCDSCSSRRSGGVSDYSDRSADTMRSETKDKIKYGIELETEAHRSQDDGAEFIREHLGTDYAVLKEDGSLSDEGIEIVTRPDSVAVHKRHWESFFASKPEKRLASWTTGRCGMHVHVTKAALTQLQLGKMLVFVNEPTNQNLVATIAGRTSDRWARVSQKKISDVRYGDDRYVALNITRRTAEFRIFKGTLNKRGFMKNLEFAQALVEFCGPGNRSMAESASATAFVKWLPRKSYPYLHDFLTAKGFIAPRPPKKGA